MMCCLASSLTEDSVAAACSLAMGLTHRACEKAQEGKKSHQIEEPAKSHRSLPLWMKVHLLVCALDLGLGSKPHLYPSKPNHRHFRDTEHA